MANSNWYRPRNAQPAKPAAHVPQRCECCETELGYTECYCMIETLCSKCNHCVTHCKCQVPTEALPYPAQLQIAIHEWRAMGVMI